MRAMTAKKLDGDKAESASQIDKFRDLARELETDEDEAAFDRALKKVSRVKPEPSKRQGD